MALRWPLEARFEQFWDLVPEWLPDGLWKLIFVLFWALEVKWLPGGEAHFKLFWALVAKLFPGGL